VFCLFSGFRHVYSWTEALSESLSSVGMGIVISASVLLLIREISADLATAEVLGKVLIEAIPISIGVSFANAKVAGRSRVQEDDTSEPEQRTDRGDDKSTQGHKARDAVRPRQWRQLRQDLREAGAAAAGALLFSFNAAPTEEIMLIESRLPAWQLCLMVPVSFGLCYVILFASGFKDHSNFVKTLFQRPVVETAFAYAIALVVSFGLLFMVGPPPVMGDADTAIGCTVVLGVEASVGAAAGRLAS
jgi:putative integral membrane protein (TIGR02587 family)